MVRSPRRAAAAIGVGHLFLNGYVVAVAVDCLRCVMTESIYGV